MKLYKKIVIAAIASMAIAGSASAQIMYQDSFDRAGSLFLTSPDVVNTNGNVWQDIQGDFSIGSSTYTTTTAGGGSVSNGTSGAIDGNAYLPVNGVSGVTLNGTLSFTLSANVTNPGGGETLGIVLADSPYQGGSQWSTGDANTAHFLAQIGVNSSGTLQQSHGNTFIANTSVGSTAAGLLTLSYNASAGTLAYEWNGITENTISVTTAQIAALNYVGIANSSFGANAGGFSNFKLTVAEAVPEPSTYALMLGGIVALVGMRRMRNRRV